MPIDQSRNKKDRKLTAMKLPDQLLRELSRIALIENKSRVLLIEEILSDYISQRSEKPIDNQS